MVVLQRKAESLSKRLQSVVAVDCGTRPTHDNRNTVTHSQVPLFFRMLLVSAIRMIILYSSENERQIEEKGPPAATQKTGNGLLFPSAASCCPSSASSEGQRGEKMVREGEDEVTGDR